MRVMALIFTVIGVTIIVLAYSGLIYKEMQAELVPLTPSWDFWINLSFGFVIALALLMMPVGLLGVLSEYYDDNKRALLFAKLADWLVLPTAIFAAVACACGFGDPGSFACA